MTERVRVENATTAPIMVPGAGGAIESGKAKRVHRSKQVDELIGVGAFRLVDDDEVDGDPLEDVKGEPLNEALRARGLPVSGTVDEKRARLREAPADDDQKGGAADA